jgi:hypothetical protein
MQFAICSTRFVAALIFTGLLAACSAEAPDTTGQSKARTSTSAADPETIAKTVVSQALGIPVENIRVISAEAREFSDSSLGCPEPDTAYLQVLTPGHQLIVEGDGRRFDVRVSGTAGRICHRRKPAPPGSGQTPESSTSSLMNPAIDHVTTHLRLDQQNIGVTQS